MKRVIRANKNIFSFLSFLATLVIVWIGTTGVLYGQTQQPVQVIVSADRHDFNKDNPPNARIARWGSSAHELVNRAATYHLPEDFMLFAQWVDALESLSTAADERKSSVAGEGIKHYIDVDDYPEFFRGELPHAYDEMVVKYGKDRVDGNGTAPWAIDSSYTDLVDHFASEDWIGAVAKAADIGHYVADIHNPMHLTLNFNGQLTGQNGIHARHETHMTNRHLPELEPAPDTVFTIQDPLASVFEWIEGQYPGVELILAADIEATAAAGGSTAGDVYYDTLWDEIGDETIAWIKQASIAIASLWYAAWLEAGSPTLPMPTSVHDEQPVIEETRVLPSVPNPFYGATDLHIEIAEVGAGVLMVYDMSGRLVRRWSIEARSPGLQIIRWSGTSDAGKTLASGVYHIIFMDAKGASAYGKVVMLK